MSHNAPGSKDELHTARGSKRSTRLKEDLQAGAKIAHELSRSPDRLLTPPSSDEV